MSADAIRPFPWKSLEAIPRSSLSALGDARRWAERHVQLDPLGRALTDLVGAEVRVRVRRATPRLAGPALEGGVGLLLDRSDGVSNGDSASALLEVEAALAAAVVARIIRRPPPMVIERAANATAASSAMAGAFAAVVVAAARRAQAAVAPRVVAAGPAEELEARFARDGREGVCLALTVLVGDDAYVARFVVAREEAMVLPPAEWTARDLAALGPTPLSIPIVACASTATLSEVASLREGDAWIPGTWKLERADGALRGAVLLAAPSAVTGVRARLVEDGRVVLSGEVDAVVADGGAGEGDTGQMTEADGKDALLSAIGDVPVVVRVEIGEAHMPAREWAALGRGDVVTLGRRVGELVVLRVGGVPVARGELVNVDGEVGVRIAERLDAARADAATAR
jgi:flagellar motor switch/type III secretory pathway protein FliN